MDVVEMPAELEELLARADGVVDDLQALALTSYSEAVVLELTRRLEQVKRRLEPVDHALVIEIEERKLPFANGCRTPAQFLRQLLRIAPGEARARFAAAKALGTTHHLTGEVVEPIYPTVAAAVAAGELSARHAQVIVAMIEQLPDEVRAVKDRAVEEYLVGYAREHDPDVLGVLARDLGRALDQDGQYNELAYRDKTRGLTVHRHADGSSRIEGNLTAECTEHFLTHLDALAAPQPAADGTPDPRTRRNAATTRYWPC